MRVTITPELKVTLLKHLIAGRNLEFAGNATGLSADQVRDIAANHGYPEPDRMQWAVDHLVKQASAIPTGRTEADKVAAKVAAKAASKAAAARPAPPARPSTPEPPAAPVTSTGPARQEPQSALASSREPVTFVALDSPEATLGQIRHAAAASTSKRTQALGDKITALVTKLADSVHAERAAAAQAAAEQAKAAARAKEIADLEAKLAALKGTKPRKAKGPTNRLTKGVHPCSISGCDRVFDTPQGVSLHERRAHAGEGSAA